MMMMNQAKRECEYEQQSRTVEPEFEQGMLEFEYEQEKKAGERKKRMNP